MSEKKFTAIPNIEEPKPPKSIPIAPTWRRIAAFLVDGLLLKLFFSFVFYLSQQELIMGYLANHPIIDEQSMKEYIKFVSTISFTLYQENSPIYQIFEIILWASYFILFWKAYGQTLGAKIFNIQILPGTSEASSPENPFLLSWGACIIRFIWFYIGLSFWALPFVFMINPQFKQRFHDFFSQTFVIFIPP
ncbi:RDD family protein [Thermospira aquatica]|uniref:RDD family protein n=1 Tax=Thermospira aquatica TaxID=2828656 RepID=A0AAX3BBD4_9SPIR|nr:RDD family protein [Thermospira aquatica]URA09530.1 RDD family protein [Thermospira aquatica]